jgi:hypothetical protein
MSSASWTIAAGMRRSARRRGSGRAAAAGRPAGRAGSRADSVFTMLRSRWNCASRRDAGTCAWRRSERYARPASKQPTTRRRLEAQRSARGRRLKTFEIRHVWRLRTRCPAISRWCSRCRGQGGGGPRSAGYPGSRSEPPRRWRIAEPSISASAGQARPDLFSDLAACTLASRAGGPALAGESHGRPPGEVSPESWIKPPG